MGLFQFSGNILTDEPVEGSVDLFAYDTGADPHLPDPHAKGTFNIGLQSSQHICLNYVVTRVAGVRKIYVFSRFAVVDRTGLDLCIRSVSPATNRLIYRSTYSDDSMVDPAVQQLALQHEQQLETGITGLPGGMTGTVATDPTAIVADLKVMSHRKYVLTSLTIDALVFTDRRLRWQHLPAHFLGAAYICTACEDKIVRKKNVVSFVTRLPCVVLVMHDAGTILSNRIQYSVASLIPFRPSLPYSACN